MAGPNVAVYAIILVPMVLCWPHRDDSGWHEPQALVAGGGMWPATDIFAANRLRAEHIARGPSECLPPCAYIERVS